MKTTRTPGKRLLLLIGVSWLVLGWFIRNAVWAVPYDPYVDGGISTGPWISSKLPRPVRRKIESASAIAMKRIQRYPSCACLFADLGEDGVDVIRRTLYFPADLRMEQKMCWRAYAFTKVGVRPTWICRKMYLLPARHIALILLHEALHHAGLGMERAGAKAPHSLITTHRVAVACGF